MAEKRKKPTITGRRREPTKFKVIVHGELSERQRVTAWLYLMGLPMPEAERRAALACDDSGSREAEDYKELESIDYAARVPLHRTEVATSAGSWRVEVEQIQSPPVGSHFVRYGVVSFIPPASGIAGRRVGMWLSRNSLTRGRQTAALKRSLASWLEGSHAEEGEYLFGSNRVSEYIPTGKNLVDGLLGLAGAVAKLSRDPELRFWGEGWLKDRERTAHPFSAGLSEAEFERHWARVKEMRLGQRALEVVKAYEAIGREVIGGLVGDGPGA